MIYTLTLNPAVDYVVFLDELKTDSINRSKGECVFFGGKGINVSLILSELDVKSVATGFTAGFTGEALEKGIACNNIKSDFIRVEEGITRINVKIRDKNETDINCVGPKVKDIDINRLFGKLDSLQKDDFLVLSGSVPSNLPCDIYERILYRLKDKGIKFIVDAEKDLLINTLKYRPFLIKPNETELGDIFGVNISDTKSAFLYAGKLKEMGAKNVLVSLGSKGAILLDENEREYFVPAHTGTAVNTVGAGDSMLAGFIAGYLKGESFEYALKLGAAAGGATAFSEGLAAKEEIFKFLNN